VPTLADWCVITLVDDDGRLRTAAVMHEGPQRIAVARESGQRDADGPPEATAARRRACPPRNSHPAVVVGPRTLAVAYLPRTIRTSRWCRDASYDERGR